MVQVQSGIQKRKQPEALVEDQWALTDELLWRVAFHLTSIHPCLGREKGVVLIAAWMKEAPGRVQMNDDEDSDESGEEDSSRAQEAMRHKVQGCGKVRPFIIFFFGGGGHSHSCQHMHAHRSLMHFTAGGKKPPVLIRSPFHRGPS